MWKFLGGVLTVFLLLVFIGWARTGNIGIPAYIRYDSNALRVGTIDLYKNCGPATFRERLPDGKVRYAFRGNVYKMDVPPEFSDDLLCVDGNGIYWRRHP